MVLPYRSHAKALDDIVPLSRRNGDDPVRDQGETSLDRPDRPARGGPEVPLEDVPMIGVDDEAPPGPAPCDVEETGRETADGARLGCVRVDHVRRLAEHQPRHLRQCLQVGEQADPASERLQLDRTETGLLRRALERRFAGIKRAEDEQRVVAPGVQARVDEGDVTRRSADIQARDDAKDLHVSLQVAFTRVCVRRRSIRSRGGLSRARVPHVAAWFRLRPGRTVSRLAPRIDRTDRCRGP